MLSVGRQHRLWRQMVRSFRCSNTDFIVLLAFIAVHRRAVLLQSAFAFGGMLDKRADGIKSDIDEARALREEAQTLLASYERKQKEVQEQADRIVSAAKEEASLAAEQAKDDLEQSITPSLAAAEDQIVSAQSAAIKEVRDQAVCIAVAAARDVIAKKMTAAEGNALIDSAIAEVDAKLH